MVGNRELTFLSNGGCIALRFQLVGPLACEGLGNSPRVANVARLESLKKQ